jgi:hypothetical protein
MPRLVQWGWWYVRSCTHASYRHGSAMLSELTALSQEKIDEVDYVRHCGVGWPTCEGTLNALLRK